MKSLQTKEDQEKEKFYLECELFGKSKNLK